MAKLTIKQTKALDNIITKLKRAECFLKHPDIAGIAKKTNNPNGSSYQVVDEDCLNDEDAKFVNVVNHLMGSELYQIYTSIPELERFIKNNGKQRGVPLNK